MFNKIILIGRLGTERRGKDVPEQPDNGKSFELNRDQAKYIDYGYTGDGLQRLAADRVIATAEKLEPATLARVSPYTRDLAVYTSERAAIQTKEPAIAKAPNLVQIVDNSQGLSL